MESHISAFALAIVSILVIQSIAFARGAMGVVVDEQGAFEAGNNYIDLNGDTVDELDHLVFFFLASPAQVVLLPPAALPILPPRPPPSPLSIRFAVAAPLDIRRFAVVALEDLSQYAKLDA